MPRSSAKRKSAIESELDTVPPLEFPDGDDIFAPGVDLDDDADTRVLPDVLPLVPIRDSVYFPHMIFPLLIGRDKSVKAIEAAVENGRLLLLAAQRQLATEDPEPDDVYRMGIAAEVMQVLKVPDGTLRVMLEGVRRVRLGQFLQAEPFFLVRAEPVEVPAEHSLEVEALARAVRSQFEQIVNAGRNIPP